MSGPLVAHALITAIGFQPHLVTRPREVVGAQVVYGITTPHPRSQETAHQLEAIARSEGWKMDTIQVSGAFHLRAWHDAWQEACSRAGSDAAINLTAGHGVSTSAATVVAFQRSLEAIVYDDILDEAHLFTPRQLEFQGKLDEAEQRILSILRDGPSTVGDLAGNADFAISHTSRVLSRLKAKGFIRQERQGNSKVNHLRPGLE